MRWKVGGCRIKQDVFWLLQAYLYPSISGKGTRKDAWKKSGQETCGMAMTMAVFILIWYVLLSHHSGTASEPLFPVSLPDGALDMPQAFGSLQSFWRHCLAVYLPRRGEYALFPSLPIHTNTIEVFFIL